MQQKALYAVLGLLVTLIGWLGSINFQKLMEIEHSLAELKVDVVKLQAGKIAIGCQTDGQEYSSDIYVSHARLYDRVLDATEVQALYSELSPAEQTTSTGD